MHAPAVILFAVVLVVLQLMKLVQCLLIFHNNDYNPAVTTYISNRSADSRSNEPVLPVQSGGCPVHVPFVVQCLVVRPDVLKPSQHAYATELPKVMPSLKTILPCAGVPGLPQDTADKRGNIKQW